VSTPAARRTIDILYVEDNVADSRLLEVTLKELSAPVRLSVVTDGEEALAFLRKQGKYDTAIRPDMILLDVNLPKKGGLEVLREVKADPHLRTIPVIVFTPLISERVCLEAYELHANCYISKPTDFDEYVEAIRTIERFWTRVVILPSKASAVQT
jgi:chemotaxis family two-component system response regulator Rcp1